MNTELVDFTRQALASGRSRDEIVTALRQAGWAQADITSVLENFAEVDFPIPVPRPKPYLSAWEVFVYLVMFLALYATAYHLADITFEFINAKLPDPLDKAINGVGFYDSIRLDISGLIVSLPLFLFMFSLANKAITRDPTKRSSRPRKWLTYLTLFIAVVSIVSDLITLVYNLLGGEFTVRFGLKVLTVAVIAGGIFYYFLADIRQDETG
jgi:hypothetical protein